MRRPRIQPWQAAIVVLLGILPPGAAASDMFTRHPIEWHPRERTALGAFYGADLTAHEGVAGAFDRSRRTEVDKFVSSLNRDFAFSEDFEALYDANHDRVMPTQDLDYVVVFREDIFEIEAVAIAMLAAGLFEAVYPAHSGVGDGFATLHLADRRSIFTDPRRPTPYEVVPKLGDFFRKYWSRRGQTPAVRVVVERPHDYDFVVYIDKLRNTIVPGAEYWEKLEVRVWISPLFGKEEAGLLIRFSADGACAAGVRSRPPSSRKFKSLDVYPEELQRIADEMSTSFGVHFNTTPGSENDW